MKRTFAAVILLAALGTLVKLAFKGEPPRPAGPAVAASSAGADVGPGSGSGADALVDARAAILARYPDDRPMVTRVLETFGHNATRIEQTDGLRGLVLLDRLGLDAVYLYDRRPHEFRKLRDGLTDEAAADILLHWREYFGLKAADDADREILVNAIARLSPSSRRIARRYPNLLPLLLAEPAGMADLIDGYPGDDEDLRDTLAALLMISLEPGPTDLRAALRTFDQFGPLAIEAFRLEGPDGLAIVHLHGAILQAIGPAVPLADALILLRVNAVDVDRMLTTRRPETIATDLRHVSAGGRKLIEAVGGSIHGLRLLVEFGPIGEQALLQAGPDAADLLYGSEAESYADADPVVRSQAVAAMAEHGPMALALLAKYQADPDFREILKAHGPAVIPTIAQADQAPEVLAYLRGKAQRSPLETVAMGIQALEKDSGQAAIRRIRKDGLERAQTLDSSELQAYQFLPLYDLVHLGGVLARGYSPTRGEMTWALVDGCFAVADVLSLITLQPEATAAAELARAEIKATAREGTRAITREIAEQAGKAAAEEAVETAAEQATKWWVVRQAGGPFAILKRLPEALAQLDLPRISDLAGPLTQRAGLRLTAWGKPLRFLTRDGEKVLRLQPGSGLRLVRNQAVATSVGLVGYRKMEEYLKSQRPGGLGEPE